MKIAKGFIRFFISTNKEVYRDIWNDKECRRLLIWRTAPYVITPLAVMSVLYLAVVLFI
jgi:hypothetical protein